VNREWKLTSVPTSRSWHCFRSTVERKLKQTVWCVWERFALLSYPKILEMKLYRVDRYYCAHPKTWLMRIFINAVITELNRLKKVK
jgi:hypothetical protein